MLSIPLITLDNDLDPRAEAVFLGLIHDELISLIVSFHVPSSTLWEEVTTCTHTLEVRCYTLLFEGRISIEITWNCSELDFCFFHPHLFNYSIICFSVWMDILYIILWVIIQCYFILSLKLFQLWPPECFQLACVPLTDLPHCGFLLLLLLLLLLLSAFSSSLSISFLYYLLVVSLLFLFHWWCIAQSLCVRIDWCHVLVLCWSLSTFSLVHKTSRNSLSSTHLSFICVLLTGNNFNY